MLRTVKTYLKREEDLGIKWPDQQIMCHSKFPCRTMAAWRSAVESHKAEMSALYLASNPTVDRFLELKKNLQSSDGQCLQGFLDRGGFQVLVFGGCHFSNS